MTLEEILTKYEIKDPYCGAGCGPGWYPLIEDLIKALIKAGWNRDLHQIKEKFGGLRFYTGATNDVTGALIDEAEDASYDICEDCGKPGSLRKSGWWKTRCQPCHEAWS